MNIHCELEYAEGYLDLGMYEEALAALDRIEAEQPGISDVGFMRLQLCIHRGAWDMALSTCEHLYRLNPYQPNLAMLAAFSMHRLRRTDQARDLLYSAFSDLKDVPIYYEHLAHYEKCLGNHEGALRWRTMAHEKRRKKPGKSDPNELPMQGLLQELLRMDNGISQ